MCPLKYRGQVKCPQILPADYSLIIVRLERIEPMREFLQSWEIEYTYIPILIPQRMSKKRILES